MMYKIKIHFVAINQYLVSNHLFFPGRSQVKRKNVLIILVTTAVFFISNFPYVFWCLNFYNLIHLFEGRTLVTYTRFTFIVMQTSCFINPFIYYFTNKGFRKFCKKTVIKRSISKEPGDNVQFLISRYSILQLLINLNLRFFYKFQKFCHTRSFWK